MSAAMGSVLCPECDATLDLPDDSVQGEILACQDCGQSYELSGAGDNITLKPAESIGEDWGE